MTALLRHRGPDSEGFHAGEAASLGMRRLAIVDIAGGDQPLYSEDGTIALVCNGEIYNSPSLRSELEARGHRFRTRSDSEVVVHLYEEEGEAFPERLEGMFACALCDERRGLLLLARDPVGIKPLYLADAPGGGLLFASEMKSLLAAPFLRREIDPAALDAYLSYLCVPEPLSIFKGVSKLPAATLLVREARGGRRRTRRYWKLGRAAAPPPAGEERERALRALLSDTVRSHLMSDAPLGLFLSGGLDSGAVAACMAQAGARLRTYSIGFGPPGESSYDERPAAALVARRFGARHTEIVASPDCAGLLPDLAWHFDEPHADSSAVLTWMISREAARGVKVALTGIGGDEVFGGYPRYLGARAAGLYRRLPAALRRAAAAAAERLPEAGSARDWGNWIKRFARGGAMDEFACYDEWLRSAPRGELDGLYAEDLKARLGPDAVRAARRAAYFSAEAVDPAGRAQWMDFTTYLPDDLLMMADKMSMASSLELRVPLCDRRLAEFMFSLPSGERAGPGGLKVLLRRALKGLLPPEILSRRKQGFMVPLPLWLKGPWREWPRELLSPEAVRRRGFFDPAAVSRLLDGHAARRPGRSDLLWALMMLEAWCRAYLDDFRPR
jgi:asparagine synthase (glutamine-hydrolysing)